MRASFTTDQEARLSLNGLWKFHFSESVAARLKGFEAISYDDSSWDEIRAEEGLSAPGDEISPGPQP